jgi:hypothetical protein
MERALFGWGLKFVLGWVFGDFVFYRIGFFGSWLCVVLASPSVRSFVLRRLPGLVLRERLRDVH